MPWTKEHLEWLKETDENIVTVCGKKIPIFKFAHDVSNETIMTGWATHLRNHYCLDSEIEMLKPVNVTNKEYLITLKFPDAQLGARIRSGDFAEIFIADYLQYVRNYYVPRTKYSNKTIKNKSIEGVDVLAFRQTKEHASPHDELLAFEVKASLSKTKLTDRLQVAIDDSTKDQCRIGESLNAIKQRLFDKGEYENVKLITRFQPSIDIPYKTNYGAAAVLTNTSYNCEVLATSNTKAHHSHEKLELLVIYGDDMMTLVNTLYERAINEA